MLFSCLTKEASLMKKYLPGFTVVALFLFTACNRSADPAGRLWFYTHSTGTKDPADSTLTPASFIDLERDGSYTSDFGRFDYGKWVYANNEIHFTSYHHSKSVLPVSYLTINEMQTGPPKGPFNNFEGMRNNFMSAAENPFSVENNGWRIKAIAKETDTQIRSRLFSHFKFWEMYFTWALNDHIEYIDVRSTPTPIKIYGNGFTLKPFNELSDAWKDCFFDEEDCRKANESIKYIFDSGNIAWPYTDNKYKMFISAFQQLQRKL